MVFAFKKVENLTSILILKETLSHWKKHGPYGARTHDFRVISTTL